MPASPAANADLFGTYDDDEQSNYRTENGLPWAIEVVQNTKVYYHPLEKIKITEAYFDFINWANTKGAQNSNWYTNKQLNKVYVP
jgi:LruC domain-containing protein